MRENSLFFAAVLGRMMAFVWEKLIFSIEQSEKKLICR